MVTEVWDKNVWLDLSKYRMKTASIVLYFVVLSFRSLEKVRPNISFKNVINGRFLSYSTASDSLKLQRCWIFAAIQIFHNSNKKFAIHEIEFENWIQFYMHPKYKNMKNLLNRNLPGITRIFLQIILTERWNKIWI